MRTDTLQALRRERQRRQLAASLFGEEWLEGVGGGVGGGVGRFVAPGPLLRLEACWGVSHLETQPHNHIYIYIALHIGTKPALDLFKRETALTC